MRLMLKKEQVLAVFVKAIQQMELATEEARVKKKQFHWYLLSPELALRNAMTVPVGSLL